MSGVLILSLLYSLLETLIISLITVYFIYHILLAT